MSQSLWLHDYLTGNSSVADVNNRYMPQGLPIHSQKGATTKMLNYTRISAIRISA